MIFVILGYLPSLLGLSFRANYALLEKSDGPIKSSRALRKPDVYTRGDYISGVVPLIIPEVVIKRRIFSTTGYARLNQDKRPCSFSNNENLSIVIFTI